MYIVLRGVMKVILLERDKVLKVIREQIMDDLRIGLVTGCE